MFMNIEVERLRRYMSKAEMATRLTIPVSLLNDWISGRQPIPANKLRDLSRLFDGCSVDYLLLEKKPPRIGGNRRQAENYKTPRGYGNS